jgi:drug/metabolite transporter (DMT)-like permease
MLRSDLAPGGSTAPVAAGLRSPGERSLLVRWDLGLVLALLSAAAFGTTGAFSKALLESGWSPGSIVLLRVAGGAVLLLGPGIHALRGRWSLIGANWSTIAGFGLGGVVLAQVSYVKAVVHLSVGVALLLEYLAVALVVLWVWLRSGRRPTPIAGLGMVAALAGLVLVLDLAGAQTPAMAGVLWGLLAAVGLASYFVNAADAGDLPPVTLAALGMMTGALCLTGLGLAGVLPLTFSTAPVSLGGIALPAWTAVAELVLVAAVLAYLTGTLATRRLGSTVASFVGLTEVLFAVLFAWLLLGEVPTIVQAAGGALIMAGVVAVRLGDLSRQPGST